jgi:hypothetical protein
MLDVIGTALKYLARDVATPPDLVRQALRLTESQHEWLLRKAEYRKWDILDAALYALVIEKVDHHHYIPPHHRPPEVGHEQMYVGGGSSDPVTVLEGIDLDP